MHADLKFDGHLSDWKGDRVGVACGPCGRHGDYRTKSLRAILGNPPMAEVPRLLAVKANCPLATRFPGHDCRAWFTVPVRASAPYEVLAAPCRDGWSLVLSCARSRQGLKSVKPCPQAFHLDLNALVAALGHDFPVNELGRRLCCPGCGSTHVTLAWTPPKAPPAETIRVPRAE